MNFMSIFSSAARSDRSNSELEPFSIGKPSQLSLNNKILKKGNTINAYKITQELYEAL